MSVDSSLNELRIAVIEKYNRAMSRPEYNNPWVAVKTSGTDPLGEYDTSGLYFRMKDGLTIDQQLSICTPTGNQVNVTIDMSRATFVWSGAFANSYRLSMFARGKYTHVFDTEQAYALSTSIVCRLLLPETFAYDSYFLYDARDNRFRGIYLSKYATINSSNWAGKSVVNPDFMRHVVCPVDADVPYYLTAFTITAEDMVGIFNNMIDRSSETTTKYITLGDANLARLTDEQKNIAISKGWDLK